MNKVEVFPINFEDKIGFTEIKALLTKGCCTQAGANLIATLRPSADLAYLNKRTALVQEWMQLIQEDAPIEVKTVVHWPNLHAKLATIGTFFEPEELLALLQMLQIVAKQLSFIHKNASRFVHLAEAAADLLPQPKMISAIQAIIDDQGKIKPNASLDLQHISKKINQAEQEIRRKLDNLFKHAKEQGYAAETGVTVRDGRLVLAILAEHKRKIKGLIHDESATGQTVYIEPAEVLEQNNLIRQLYLDYNREVRKILLKLTELIRPFLSELSKLHQFLGYMDALHAIAKWGVQMNAFLPALRTNAMVNLINAKHPLLLIHHQKQQKGVVPFSLNLQNQQHILVISGPNAGGKSVTLKATLLLVYMAQCGLPITADANTEIAPFNQFFVDIGDQQSIENDLSTYSSHLTAMRHFVEKSNEKTLFAIDEFGMGTDPQLGGPIAESIMTQLHQSKAYGIINTHFSNLKMAATSLNGCFNGAMGFDSATLNPQYTLEIGRPGSSYAFEIAQKIGMPSKILDNAKCLLTDNRLKLEDMLVQLEAQQLALAQEKALVKQKDDLLAELIAKYEHQNQKIKERKAEIISKARTEAKQLIQEANRKIEEAIKNIKYHQASSTINQEARAVVQEIKLLVAEKLPESETIITPLEQAIDFKPEVGFRAQLLATQTQGIIEAIKGKRALLSSDSMKIWVNVSELTAPTKSDKEVNSFSQTGQLLSQKILEFESKLDLRGTRSTEATQLLMKFIDEAILLNQQEVQILHGKGDGILRKIIREYLHGIKAVKSFKSEHPDRGGDGITLVSFN